MLRLDRLEPLVKKRKRVGRGGSRGKTCGRGEGGQKRRSGGNKGLYRFEGGQMPLIRRIPRRGFVGPHAIDFELVNLRDLERAFGIDQEVGREQLIEAGIIKGRRGSKVKLLASGDLTKSLKISVDAASKTAGDAVKKAGGVMTLIGR